MIRRLTGRRTPRPHHADEGASLVLALIFVTFIGLVVGALLTYSGAGIASAQHTLAADQSEYDAGGALQTAINAVRTSTWNDPNSPCLNANGYVDVPDGSGSGATVRVACQGGPGTGGAAGQVPITSANKPGSAILTLGTSEPGIQLGSNGTLSVKGQIRDNTGVTRGGSKSAISLVGNSTLEAKGDCTGVTIDPAASAFCPWTPSTTADKNSFADPISLNATAYAPPPTGVADLVYRPVPKTCSALITFDPGYYDDAAALTNLTTTCSGVLWFKPGQYYFDFHNREGAGGLSGSDVWSVNNSGVRIVAGTPQGWTTSPLTQPSIPGSCVSPLSSTAAGKGVQFAFGGDSSLQIDAGQMEICGQYSSAHPSLAVYGMPSGTAPSPQTAHAATYGSGATYPSGDVHFSPASALAATDGTWATAAIDSTPSKKADTAGIVATNFDTGTFPAGSYATTATVSVTHKETLTSGALDTADMTVTAVLNSDGAGGTAPQTITFHLHPSSASSTESSTPVAVTPDVAKILHSGSPLVSTVTVEETAKTQKGTKTQGTVELDSIRLSFGYTPPSVRGETTPIMGSNCIANLPYSSTDSTTCALIRTQGAQTRLYIQGTTYAPAAALDIQLTNISSQVFRAGVIVRTLVITVTASSSYTGPVIEIPDDSPGASLTPLDVYFSAYTCPPGASCSGVSPPNSPWHLAGQATAAFTDPALGARGVTITSWNLPR